MADNNYEIENSVVADTQTQAQTTMSLPREDLITTAAKFLTNPKVKSSPMAIRRNFLEKKGLTPQEIDIAIQRSETTLVPTAPVPNTIMYSQLPSPLSRWTFFREMCSVGFVLCASTYGLYQLWKNFLKPYFFGGPTDEERVAKIEKSVMVLESSVETAMAQLQNVSLVLGQILQKLEDVTTQVSRKDRGSESFHFHELKSEITSLKGLLLNRKQFPPTPVTNPVIPTWQLVDRTNSEEPAGSPPTEHESVDSVTAD